LRSHEKDDAGFYKVVRLQELAQGEMLQVPVEDDGSQVEVALTILENGQLIAFRDVCPHMAFPLSIGRLKGNTLECAGHLWKFDITTGKTLFPPIRKNMVLFEVRVDNDEVWVKIDPFF
jgi:nitrite reductase/ring-hydroxylating ferredoxin subunit